ncbi:MAG: FAD-dependent oxidoreductase [Gammaproteobacteria bacterium]|nr:FAD-dependent oxidoreductase [Gammaproteobacteria bacterium]NIM72927.1 FAD-dependent oxidoreductase [Gammaproteobacteria bacterium]NIN38538.1 FAD-dependent oxidoreductase [Gammaproteobacteria bacterium]NIO24679.1 FAD-dependent oxidoreductase [Gammaproteobacteria bacterium]NIO65282.1 FAD-dependent oxidoreductase [Gammaproteobacteria bacterium]
MGVYDINRILVPPAPGEYRDDTADAHYVPAPCQVACPVGTDAPSYLAYIWEGRYEEAFEAITATNPFSSICGRVCDAPCEPACRRESADGAVQIRNLKRFVMDKVGHRYDPPAVPVSKSQSVGIVGAGPAGLVAAHDLCVAGYAVDVYEMTDRPGGMMVWGIPAFRLPPGIIEEDIERLEQRCPGLSMHYNTALGRDVSLDELKQRHDAVLLTIGSWWGKAMRIPGEGDARVVDGVGFLRRVNAGERPELPQTVAVIGGGDVAMDACRVAKRLPGCKHVKVIYRRGPEDIPARRIELEGAIKEGIEFVYSTQQVSVNPKGNGLELRCVRTEPGPADADGRRRPVVVKDSEHGIDCGMVIAAVGQQAECDELERRGMMGPDRVHADFAGMRTDDDKVFAAGDGAFGGSTIVMAMSHGQRAAYYIEAFLEGRDDPMPYRTPYRTRRVPVAQDLMWERLAKQEPEFFGLGKKPIEFPEIESTYDEQTARREAARCYRCDAETGSADYSVHHREDLFSMARTNVIDHAKHKAMLSRRLRLRDNPFPDGRAPSLDDLVFLPANLSRLVIDPYREACRIDTDLGGRLNLELPYLATGFDDAPEEVRAGVAEGLRALGCGYVGRRPIDDALPWLQLIVAGESEPSPEAKALLHVQRSEPSPPYAARLRDDQLLGMVVSSSAFLEQSIVHALDHDFDLLLLDATAGIESGWSELRGAPSPEVLRDAIAILRRLNREEAIDLVYFGGVRSGTDSAKLMALGAKAVILGMALGLAAGGYISEETSLEFTSDWSDEERARAIVNIVTASAGEASMMARCTGKTNLHNLEPEDLRSVTLATATATGVPLAGTRPA